MRLPPDAAPLPFPVQLVPWIVASFHGERGQLRALWGDPHFVEEDPFRTAGGEEDSWAWELPTGQRVLIVLAVPYKRAYVHCDPPDLDPILVAFEFNPTVQDLEMFRKPTLAPGYTGPTTQQ
jgi:hypothetical protein